MKLNTLQRKIMFAFLILLIIQINIYALVTYLFETRIIYEQVADANMNTLKEMKNHLEVKIRILDGISDQLSSSEVVQTYLKNFNQLKDDSQIENSKVHKFNDLLKATQQTWPEIFNIHMYSIYGNIVSLKESDIALPVPKLKYFEKESVQLDYGVKLNKSTNQKGTVVSYMKLVNDIGSGEHLGWVRLDFNTSDINFIKELSKDDRMFFVFEPNGKLILSSKPGFMDIVLLAKLLNIKAKSDSFFYKKNLINYHTSDLTGWKIVSIVPEKLLNKGILKVKVTSILLISISVIVSIIASNLISHKITRPLKILYNSMKNIEQGNFKTIVRVISNDEIGELGNQLNVMAKSIDTMINQVYKVELKYRDAQFTSLLTQINPHFLYNTLEIIDVLSLKGKQKEVSEVVYSLSSMFRYTLKSKKFVPLREELQNAESYLNIQKIRYENSFHFKVVMKHEELTYTVPIFILQPILENSFKYGLFRKKRNYLNIYSENTPEYYKIHIIDNGVGMTSEDLSELKDKLGNTSEEDQNDKKIGLANVNQRIQLIFGMNFGLEISSLSGHWCKVTLLLPPQEVLIDGF